MENTSDASDWAYLGEGNQNLVVRYVGKDPVFLGKVLRVVKSSKFVHPNASLFRQQFTENVIKPLVGEDYILNLYPIHTSPSFLCQIAAQVESKRPESRLLGAIVTDAPISFLMEDLTNLWPSLPTLTFELKPKWGFMPQHTQFAIKKQYCRFCMHSHMKKIELNGYCPLDLYSQNLPRVNKALSILLKEHPLEKTLRVSMNGKQVSLCHEPSAAVLNDTQLQVILSRILLKDPILLKLKQLQQDLDEMDVEAIYPLYENIKNTSHFNATDIHTWVNIVQQYLQKKESNASVVQKILMYVLSMTFKDCSIMINVAPIGSTPSTDKYIAVDKDVYFQYDIKVIDTDLKSIDKIPYWYELDQSIVNHALATHLYKSTCQ